MADAKPDDKKAAPKPIISWEEVILLILGIVALIYVFIPKFSNEPTEAPTVVPKDFSIKNTYNRLFNETEQKVVNNNGQVIEVTKQPSLVNEGKSIATDFLTNAFMIVCSILTFFALLFYALTSYSKFKKDLIVAEYKKKFETAEEEKLEDAIDAANIKVMEQSVPDNNGIINPKWEVVGKYYNSANQSDWKLAILEADIMLYEVLDKSGFPGESIGEMLKGADRSKLENLDAAWSAHKVRNQIAHSGTDFVLTRDLVERTVANYEKVFDELNFI